MADLNIEMNVKTNTGYDQLYPKTKSNLVSYTTDRTGASSINEVKSALDFLMNGTIITIAGQDVLAYFVSTQKDKSCISIRGWNNPNPPTGQNPTTNDLCYVSFKINSTHINVIALDVQSKNIYSNVMIGGTWNGWENFSNAKTLDGISRTSFMQNYPNGTGLNLNSTTYVQPYVANIEPSTSIGVGLPDNWWHLMYLPHNATGYGCQIAYPLDSATQKPKYRIALGTTWQDWQNFNDGGNAETVDGYHANPAIGTPALKQIYAGTSDMVAGTTNLAQGTVYFVYE